jgi:hypothetical protein
MWGALRTRSTCRGTGSMRLRVAFAPDGARAGPGQHPWRTLVPRQGMGVPPPTPRAPHSALIAGAMQEGEIGGSLPPDGRHGDAVVTAVHKPATPSPRERRVDQELHRARSTASSSAPQTTGRRASSISSVSGSGMQPEWFPPPLPRGPRGGELEPTDTGLSGAHVLADGDAGRAESHGSRSSRAGMPPLVHQTRPSATERPGRAGLTKRPSSSGSRSGTCGPRPPALEGAPSAEAVHPRRSVRDRLNWRRGR